LSILKVENEFLSHFHAGFKYLNTKIITERPQKTEKENWIIAAKKPAYVPAANHPWRSKFLLKV